MTTPPIKPSDFRRGLVFVADAFVREEPRLNALDGAIGDGDHGITVRTGFDAIRRALPALEAGAGLEQILREAGTAFMGATGGAIGIIFGRMLMSAGMALHGREDLGPAELVAMLQAMEKSIATTGKAKPGDKTILDAVHAAAAVHANQDLLETLRLAAQAAQKGADETTNMLCKVGRASKLGDRALGHSDPGANSFAVFVKALAEWVETRQTQR